MNRASFSPGFASINPHISIPSKSKSASRPANNNSTDPTAGTLPFHNENSWINNNINTIKSGRLVLWNKLKHEVYSLEEDRFLIQELLYPQSVTDYTSTAVDLSARFAAFRAAKHRAYLTTQLWYLTKYNIYVYTNIKLLVLLFSIK